MITHDAVYERLDARRYLVDMPDAERELRIELAREVWVQCIKSAHAKKSNAKGIPCAAHEDACRTILGRMPLSSIETRTLWRHAKAGVTNPFPVFAPATESFEEFVESHIAYEAQLKELL